MVDDIKNNGTIHRHLPYNISDVKSENFNLISLFEADTFKAPVSYSKPDYDLDTIFRKNRDE